MQTAIGDKHPLIVAHEVNNVGHDRAALATMAKQARAATAIEDPGVSEDRGALIWNKQNLDWPDALPEFASSNTGLATGSPWTPGAGNGSIAG